GVDGVEGEGGLSGAGEAGDYGEGVARNGDVDVAEVVLAGSADGDVCDAHIRLRPQTAKLTGYGMGRVVLKWYGGIRTYNMEWRRRDGSLRLVVQVFIKTR